MNEQQEMQFDVTDLVTEKIVKTHSLTILGVCLGFGILNFIMKNTLIATITVVMGFVISAFGLFPKNVSKQTKGMVLSVAQILLIIAMATMKHELHNLFSLMIASIAISAIYFNLKIFVTQIVIIDTTCVLGLIFNNFFNDGYSVEALIKGIAGINVAFFLMMYLIKYAVKNVRLAKKAENESLKLIDEVNEKVRETQEAAARQRAVVEKISVISEQVNESSAEMREIADRLSESTDEQEVAINSITEEMAHITAETQKGMEQSGKASKAAKLSSDLLHESNTNMEHMLTAMAEIEKSSAQIEGIVKTIEDIAFQTNILALNASVEAARAGAAGKGFAVVADEVRNLAGKSQEAVGNTSSLIESSMNAVKRGKEIADQVAGNMAKVIETAKKSEKYAGNLAALNEEQAGYVSEVKVHTEEISRIIAQGSQLSEKSSQIANAVAEQVGQMDMIVQDFR